MGTDLEIVLVRAGCSSEKNQEIYWIFSRAQLEFVLKELDHDDSSGSPVIARYQDMLLPVLSLGDYFGFTVDAVGESQKYMVLRSADENKKLTRLIVPSNFSPQILKLTNAFASLTDFTTPANSFHIRGAYSLGRDKVGVVPDVGSICQGLV